MIARASRASLRFYAELNDHLAPCEQHRTIEREFFVPTSIKDMIESCGVPHTEVELVVVNGESSEFSRLVRDGDRVAVYPLFEAFDITPELRVRNQPLRNPRFVLDVHLGRLARYLRMLGIDAAYSRDAADPELVRVAVEQKRTLLTRDRGLLKYSAVTHGYWVRETESRSQAAEVVLRFDLARSLRPFTRCMACNGLLIPVSPAVVAKRVPARVAASQKEFRECPDCGRVYWQGTHYHHMRQWIEELAALTSKASRAPVIPEGPGGASPPA
jgi:uncharacterized protein